MINTVGLKLLDRHPIPAILPKRIAGKEVVNLLPWAAGYPPKLSIAKDMEDEDGMEVYRDRVTATQSNGYPCMARLARWSMDYGDWRVFNRQAL